MKRGERLVGRIALCLGEDHLIPLDPIGQFIAFANPQRGPDRLRDRGLGLAGDLAGDQADATVLFTDRETTSAPVVCCSVLD